VTAPRSPAIRRDASSRLARWLGVIAVLSAIALRPLVLCTGDDGATHIEFAHAEGACCDHEAHGHVQSAPDGDTGDSDTGEPAAQADPSCSNIALAVDVAPAPRPDSPKPPAPEPTVAPATTPHLELPDHRAPTAHPPTTGPPRPRRFLRQHATVVLRL
jgi:hypothetical protein